jgi:hypothetical protein
MGLQVTPLVVWRLYRRHAKTIGNSLTSIYSWFHSNCYGTRQSHMSGVDSILQTASVFALATWGEARGGLGELSDK